MINNTAFNSGPLGQRAGRPACILRRLKTLHHPWQWHGRTVNGANGLGYQNQGDAVFVPDFTYSFATGEVVSLKVRPRYSSWMSKEDTFNMDPGKLEDAIWVVFALEGKLTPKLIVPVDLFGLHPQVVSGNFKDRRKYVGEMKNPEDGAQGFGGMLGSKRACSLVMASITSFFPANHLAVTAMAVPFH